MFVVMISQLIKHSCDSTYTDHINAFTFVVLNTQCQLDHYQEQSSGALEVMR